MKTYEQGISQGTSSAKKQMIEKIKGMKYGKFKDEDTREVWISEKELLKEVEKIK